MAGVGLRLYQDLMSQPCRAVYLFLKSTSIPFTNQPVALRKGEHFKPEFKAINPHQQVPAIDDNGFKLNESVAILKYLADKYSAPNHWYPKDLQSRARVDSVLAWQHLGFRLYAANVFLTKYLHPIINKAPVDTEKLAFFQGGLETSLDKVEKIYLKGSSGSKATTGGPLYLCSEDGNGDISVADLVVICELMQPVAVGHDVFKDRPRLEAWARRVKERVGNELFDDTHKFIYKVRDQFAAESPDVLKF